MITLIKLPLLREKKRSICLACSKSSKWRKKLLFRKPKRMVNKLISTSRRRLLNKKERRMISDRKQLTSVLKLKRSLKKILKSSIRKRTNSNHELLI